MQHVALYCVQGTGFPFHFASSGALHLTDKARTTGMAYDNTGGIIAAAVILEVLAVLCTSLRFLSRRMRAQGYRADDWLTVPAMVSFAP